jgi:hypothetical protein
LRHAPPTLSRTTNKKQFKQTLADLGVGHGSILVINDRALAAPQRVRVAFVGAGDGDTPMDGGE